ncbi:RNA polymerase sigma factor RpoH [Curvibacter sp. CHRR-16]|uniref:RNA polymerase sigma factor RpoH n=1 Tax=Curvibacter sp. CHRR-16 TaxID=2835872 RepID=UPI001BDAA169|nr:RNA polymerase sigma factor RpoH [Curvibacter sp. CHRR-16]MBT0571776.1 RNA polymerase sigma factor RpoH [Curvibacter sp. CHRR-16]
MTALTTTSAMQIAPISANSAWAVAPSLGNLDAYIRAANNMPMLTPEEEQDYARRFQQNNDLEAAGKLVMSHLRLVISISRQYLGYGLPHADLIQEGNIGLMKAVKRFDPDQGVRLVSYAMHWIKSEIHEYILRNWRMVKVATTKAQRKLFFNLRSMKQRYQSDDAMSDADSARDSMSSTQVAHMAQELGVKPEEVLEMETRMAGGDVLLDPSPSEDDSSYSAPIAYLSDTRHEPTAMLEAQQRDYLLTDGISAALDSLDARSRRIVEERWLKVNDDSSGGMTLHELAAEYGVSAERIRQIEVAAMKKMRTQLAAYA